MLFIIDEDMPRSLATVLKKEGYEVIDIRDVGLRGATDYDILNFSNERKGVIITADVGFASLSFKDSTIIIGFVLLRIPNEFTVQETIRLVLQAFKDLGEENIRGNIVVIDPQKIRIRRMKH